MFGNTALKTLAGDAALKVVCAKNMERSFNVMAWVSASKPGTFLVDKIWDQVAGKITEAAKKQVEGIFTSPAVGNLSALSEPLVFQNDLRAYTLRLKTSAFAVGQDIRDNRSLSAAQKDQMATSLYQGLFFSKAPKSDVIGDRQKAADLIELAFYMVLVTNSDYIMETTRTEKEKGYGVDWWVKETKYSHRRVSDVTLPTTDPRYGNVPASKNGGDVTYAINYESLGNKIRDRINTIYKSRIGGTFLEGGFWDWFYTGLGKGAVAKAESTIVTISSKIGRSPV
jgi:hypothetical protein